MPYQRYIELNKERLMRLHEGLEILEMVDRDAIGEMNLCVYGLTSDRQILDAAREAIADEAELDENDVQLTEIAVAIPISSDTIYALTGSGIRLKDEEFVYLGGGGKGPRSLSFTFAHYKPTVNLNAFSVLGLASSESWVDDFLMKEGNKQPAQITPNVHRTQEATQPGAPAAPAQHPQQPQQPQPGMPKQTSLSAFLDDFLD
jgi:hypothetical protein